MRAYLKSVFKSVTSASLTLDKVTVSRIAYTVLVSFFFHEGEIAAVLNDLRVMKSTEYDGANTASMVGLDLVASLGIKREQIGEIFHHTIYDGVYANAEERVRGGGCLSLNKHFAEWCGLPQDSFTGNWDMGHKLQLVYGDVLLEDSNLKEFNKVVFGSMGDFISGQQALKFKELSHQLNQPTLSNKKSQDTRWARANLRAYAGFYRNVPMLYILYGRQAAACALENVNGEDDDEDEYVNEVLVYFNTRCEELCDGKLVALGIGGCQLLEHYSKASLDSQRLSPFPPTVLHSINELKEKLQGGRLGGHGKKKI